MINTKNIIKTFYPLNVHALDYMGCLYMSIFEEPGKPYRIYYNKSNKLCYNSSFEMFNHKKKGDNINDRNLLNAIYADEQKDHDNIIRIISYSSYENVIVYDNGETRFMFHITTNDGEESSISYLDIMTNDIDKAFEIVKPWIKKKKIKKDVEFGITAMDGTGYLYTSWYNYENHLTDIKANYNDDIPYERLCQLLENEDNTELILFYGEPGTGKSSLIKHFISKYPDTSFVFMDGSLLANIGQEKLMGYFLENQNTVFILEDCEKALMNREHYNNQVMPILLNLTDGIIADVLGIKLICTFNTALSNIDKALIRKGRLSLKYEFKKLCKEKVRKLLKNDSINEDMSLADIYNYNEENDYSKKQTTKIGF